MVWFIEVGFLSVLCVTVAEAFSLPVILQGNAIFQFNRGVILFQPHAVWWKPTQVPSAMWLSTSVPPSRSKIAKAKVLISCCSNAPLSKVNLTLLGSPSFSQVSE